MLWLELENYCPLFRFVLFWFQCVCVIFDSALIFLPAILHAEKSATNRIINAPFIAAKRPYSFICMKINLGNFSSKNEWKKILAHAHLSYGISIPLNPIFVSTSSFMLVEVTQSSSIWFGHSTTQAILLHIVKHSYVHIIHTQTTLLPQNALLASTLTTTLWTTRCM